MHGHSEPTDPPRSEWDATHATTPISPPARSAPPENAPAEPRDQPPAHPTTPDAEHPQHPRPARTGPARRERSLAESSRRLAERPLPSAGGAIAAAGIAVAVLGVVVWAGGYAVSAQGSPRTWLGIVASLVVVAVGYLLAARFRSGPLGTAGVAASALGVPTALGFLTFQVGTGTPVDFDVVFLLSIAIWLLSYLFAPGARGHGVYLGLCGLALWAYLDIKISPNLFGLPFQALERTFADSANPVSDPTRHLATLATVSLVLGGAYYVLAAVLDARGRRGMATPLVLAGFPAVLGGLVFASHPLNQAGTGVAFVVAGAVLAVYGGRAHRRFTAWAWAAGIGYGVLLLVADAVPHNHTAAGIAFVVVGAVLVLFGASLSAAFGEREYPDS